MSTCTANSSFLIPTFPYPPAPPPPDSIVGAIMIGEVGNNVITYTEESITLRLSNLRVTETGIFLHYFSRGILRVYDFVNNNDGTGSITLDLSPNFAAVFIVLVTIDDSGNTLNVGYRGYICKEAQTLEGQAFRIYPKFSAESLLFYSLYASIPDGSFFNINQPYNVPYSDTPTEFILDVKEVGVPVTIVVQPNNKNFAPKRMTVIPNRLQEIIRIQLAKDTSLIEIATKNGDVYKTKIAATNIGTILSSYSQDMYSYLVRRINNNFNSIYSLFSSQLALNLIDEDTQKIIPKDLAGNTVANRLLLKSLASNETSVTTIRDILIACTQNNPIITANTMDTDLVDPVINPLFNDQEMLGGSDVFIWSDNYCMVSWELYKKYLNNRGLQIKKADQASIIFTDENGNDQTCIYDVGDNECSILSLYDFCYENIQMELNFDNHMYLSFGQVYPLDSIVQKNERRAYLDIDALRLLALRVGEFGNSISITFTPAASANVTVNNLSITIEYITGVTTVTDVCLLIAGSVPASALLMCEIEGSPTELITATGTYMLSGGFKNDYASNMLIKEKHAQLDSVNVAPFAPLIGNLVLETSLPLQNIGNKKVYSGNTATFNLSGTSLTFTHYTTNNTPSSVTVNFTANGMTAIAVASVINTSCAFITASTELTRVTVQANSGYVMIDPASTALPILGNFILIDNITFTGETLIGSIINTIVTQGDYVTATEDIKQTFVTVNTEPYASSFTTSGINGIINKTLYVKTTNKITNQTLIEKIYFDTFVPSPPNPGGAGAGNTYTVATAASAVAYQINLQTATLDAVVNGSNGVDINAINGIVIDSIFGDAVAALGGLIAVQDLRKLIIHSKLTGHISDTTTLRVSSASTPAVLLALGWVVGDTGYTETYPTYPKTIYKEKYDLLLDDPYLENAPYIARFDGGMTLDSFKAPAYRYPEITSKLVAPFYGLKDKHLYIDVVTQSGTQTLDIFFDSTYHPTGTPITYYPFALDYNTIDEVVDYVNYISNLTYGGIIRAYKKFGNKLHIETHQPNQADKLIIREEYLIPTPNALFSFGFNSYYSEYTDVFDFGVTGSTFIIQLQDIDANIENFGTTLTGTQTVATLASLLNTEFQTANFPCFAEANTGHLVLSITDKDFNFYNIVGDITIFGTFIRGAISSTIVIYPPTWKNGIYVGALTSTEFNIPMYVNTSWDATCVTTP